MNKTSLVESRGIREPEWVRAPYAKGVLCSLELFLSTSGPVKSRRNLGRLWPKAKYAP